LRYRAVVFERNAVALWTLSFQRVFTAQLMPTPWATRACGDGRFSPISCSILINGMLTGLPLFR
jgi:hypothetical protein